MRGQGTDPAAEKTVRYVFFLGHSKTFPEVVYRKPVCSELFKHYLCFTALNLGCFRCVFKMAFRTLRNDP